MFDPDQHCIHPFKLSGLVDPITIQDKLSKYKQLLDLPVMDEQSFQKFMVDAMTLISMPVIVPRVELVDPEMQPAERPIVVMGPTAGHTPTLYNFLSPQDQAIAVSNQTLAVGWEMTRQALTKMGANVVVADDLYLNSGLAEASFGAVQPVQQVFTRDPGVVIDDIYYIASTDAVSNTFNKVSKSVLGANNVDNSTAVKGLAEMMARFKYQHGLNVKRAFNIAGTSLNHGTIDAFFEGGDIFVDQRKGIVLFGDDQLSNKKHGTTGNGHALFAEFEKISNNTPVVIERPFTLAGKGRGDGERFHLDCFMSLLPKGELLIDPRYTTAKSLETLKDIYGTDLIEIGPENLETIEGPVGGGEVPNYTANLVAVGHQLLMPTCSQQLKSTLKRRGYSVVTAENFGVPPGLFYMRGGSIHCVTQTLPAPYTGI